MKAFNIAFTVIAAATYAAADLSEKDVTYAVRTAQDPKNQNFDEPVDTSKINSSYPVIMITHGWVDDGNSSWIQNLTDAYFEHGNYNIIAVNWRKPATQLYSRSVIDNKGVGYLFGDAIVKINKEKNIPLKNFHLIGHSLGAHTVGFAAQRVKESTGTKLSWLTGLDPAGPLYEVPKAPKSERLSSDDAEVVEVIHTDGGIAGFHNSLGTIDFYPNGGRYIQPNCDNDESLLKKIPDSISCSHHKSVEYYTYAVRKQGIAGTRCNSWEVYENGGCKGNKQAEFGTKQPPEEKGSYYLTINK